MIDHSGVEAAVKYRADMEWPMENLATEIFGLGSTTSGEMTDAQIIEHTVKKIKMLKEMLLATGLSEKMLDACMVN